MYLFKKEYFISYLINFVPRAIIALFSNSTTISYSGWTHTESITGFYHYPIYKLLSYILWQISFHNLSIYILTHLLIHSFFGVAIYILGKQFNFSNNARWLSVFFISFLPYYVSTSANQPQFGITLVIMAFTLISYIYWHQSDYRFKPGLYFFLATCICVAIRPNSFLTWEALCLFSLIFLILNKKNTKKNIQSILFMSICILGVFYIFIQLPKINKQFQVVPSVFGLNFYFGNNPHVIDTYLRFDGPGLEAIPLPTAIRSIKDERIQTKALKKHTLNYIKYNPLQTIKNTLFKSIYWWNYRLNNAHIVSLLKNLLFTLPYLFYLPFAIYGFFLMLSNKKYQFVAMFMLVVIVSYWLPHTLLMITIRYRMTTEFLLIIMSSYGFLYFLNQYVFKSIKSK